MDAFFSFLFNRESGHGGNSDAFPSPLHTEFTQTNKRKKKQNKNQLSNLSKWWMCTFITLLKTLTVLWALSEQLPIVHVSTDPWRGCDRFYNLNFLAFQKESQVKSRNDIIYTGFHMQLRSWRLKLQPKIMSYQH